VSNCTQTGYVRTGEDVAGGFRALVSTGPTAGSAITRLMPRYGKSMPGDGPEHSEPELPVGRVRQRAPRRTAGRRAQLTVPEGMWSEIAQIAAQAGTTPNDVLVQLAAEQLREHRRRRELQARAELRWRAFRGAVSTPGGSAEPLGESELIALGRALRDDA
jgi:hypothetical protein